MSTRPVQALLRLIWLVQPQLSSACCVWSPIAARTAVIAQISSTQRRGLAWFLTTPPGLQNALYLNHTLTKYVKLHRDLSASSRCGYVARENTRILRASSNHRQNKPIGWELHRRSGRQALPIAVGPDNFTGQRYGIHRLQYWHFKGGVIVHHHCLLSAGDIHARDSRCCTQIRENNIGITLDCSCEWDRSILLQCQACNEAFCTLVQVLGI